MSILGRGKQLSEIRVKRPKGKDVRALREQMGLTQEEFGRLVYRSLRIVQDWEGDNRLCPLDTWEYVNLLHSSRSVRQWRRKFLRLYGNSNVATITAKAMAKLTH